MYPRVKVRHRADQTYSNMFASMMYDGQRCRLELGGPRTLDHLFLWERGRRLRSVGVVHVGEMVVEVKAERGWI
jgi:hypothetical protein